MRMRTRKAETAREPIAFGEFNNGVKDQQNGVKHREQREQLSHQHQRNANPGRNSLISGLLAFLLGARGFLLRLVTVDGSPLLPGLFPPPPAPRPPLPP